MKTPYVILIVLALAGCTPEPQVTGENYITLDGRPVAEGVPLEQAEADPPIEQPVTELPTDQ